jgi:hypothetical protein
MSAAVVISNGLNRDRRSHFAGPGVYVLAGEYELVAGNLDDADDKVILDKFPARCRILGGTVHIDDVDSGTDLVWDLSTATDLIGTVGTVLISNSTAGQAAGSDSIDETKIGTECGGEYLMAHVNTGGVGTGTLSWFLLIAEDVDYQAHSSSITAAQAAAPGEDVT